LINYWQKNKVIV